MNDYIIFNLVELGSMRNAMKINGIVEIRRIIELSVYKNLKHVLIRPNLQVHLMNG